MATKSEKPVDDAAPSSPQSGPTDPVRHQQAQPLETENRAPGKGAPADIVRDPVGRSAGPDTAGVVAPPAVANLPGSSTELGGVTGAADLGSGRNAD